MDIIFGRDDVIDAKPDPEGLITIIKLLGLEKEFVLFIGDTDVDEKAAKSAKIPYLHVSKLEELLNQLS